MITEGLGRHDPSPRKGQHLRKTRRGKVHVSTMQQKKSEEMAGRKGGISEDTHVRGREKRIRAWTLEFGTAQEFRKLSKGEVDDHKKGGKRAHSPIGTGERTGRQKLKLMKKFANLD